MAALMTNHSTLIFFIITLFLKLSFSFVPDLSDYPPASQSCLTNAAVNSGCNADSSTFEQNNACLCSNGGGFFNLAAQCIEATAPGALQNVYAVAVTNCDISNTPVTISLAQFLAAAQDGASSIFRTSMTTLATAPQSAITASLPNPSTTTIGSSGNSNGGGLSKSDIIALAVGVPATVCAIIGVFIMCYK
jgi:hypothetical protein